MTVGINADSLATWFFPAVGGFLDCERVLLDLSVDDQAETLKLLKNGEVLGCVFGPGRAHAGVPGGIPGRHGLPIVFKSVI